MSVQAFFTPDKYAQIREGIQSSAAVVVPLVYKLVEPGRVLDVGGGEGWWSAEFAKLGAKCVCLDESVTENTAGHAGVEMRHLDLEAIPRAPEDVETYDLAVCLEVAEHLAPDHADEFVAFLCRSAPAILFSAAVPGQGGHGHLNEQWPSYWAERFHRRGFAVTDTLRWQIWDDGRVEPWYRQNILLAARREWLTERHITFKRSPRDVVHPDIYGWRIKERAILRAQIETLET